MERELAVVCLQCKVRNHAIVRESKEVDLTFEIQSAVVDRRRVGESSNARRRVWQVGVEAAHAVQYFERRILRAAVVGQTISAEVHESLAPILNAGHLGECRTTPDVNQSVLLVRVLRQPEF